MKKKNYTTWFQHDSNAMNNRNLKAMRSVYSMEGIGCWWTLQEILSTQPGYKLDISTEYAMNELADDLRLDAAYVERYINDCVNKFHLLECDDTHLWSPSLIEAMVPLDEKREVLSERGKRGGQASGVTRRNKAQVQLSATNDEAQVEENEAQNKTEQNKTEQNNYPEGNSTTVSLVDNTIALPAHRNDGPTDIALLTQRVLNDDIHFCSYHIRPGGLKDKHELEAWLNAFNKWLRYGGEHIRNENSYRVHFKNWIVRQDLRKNPATYDPVTDTTAPWKGKANIPLEMPKKTPQQLLAEQAAYEEELTKRLNAM